MARHLYIAGIDRWNDYIRDSLSIDSTLTYQIDTARLRVKGYQPSEGDEVIIEDDNLGRLFGGIIVKVDLADTIPDRSVSVWEIDCDDYTGVLDRRLVVETYSNMYADAIFKDIILKYCRGFTSNGVNSGAPIVEQLIFDYVPVSEAFKHLCDYVGWQWQPDYYKDLSFFSTDDLTSEAPLTLTTGGYFRNLKHSIDQTGLRNRIYVRGGTMLSDPFTYSIVSDGTARTWTLPHKPHDITFNLGNVGIENVDKEEDYTYLMNFQEKYVRCSSQTSTPAQGTTLSWTYKYDIDVITTVEDFESQKSISDVQGGDGVYEHVLVDDSLTTIEAAEAAGNADLRDHSNPQIKGSFDTEYIDTKSGFSTWSGGQSKLWGSLTGDTWGDITTPPVGWKPGQLVSINLPDRGINGTYLIQRVSITSATKDKWTFHVEYGGRLFGIADFLKALVSSQQKKQLNDTALLHKFAYGQETSLVSDKVISIVGQLSYVCGDPNAICGFVQCG